MKQLVPETWAVECPVGHHGEEHSDLPASKCDAAVNAASDKHSVGNTPAVASFRGDGSDRHGDIEAKARAGGSNDFILQSA